VDRLLQVKLTVPRRSQRLISRPRLVELLDRALEARLVLLSAPPGFGKTTALVDWLAASETRCAWLSLDAADNDPVRFLRYLWAAVANAAADGASSLVAEAPSAEVPDVIGEVATILAERTAPSILVLDDYHVIEAPEVQRAVSMLLDCLPAQAHLVIATRVDPALPLARLRARGELLEVRGEALRFTTEEARTFFAERIDVTLSDADVETLVDRTEGWPALLQLAGLSLARRTDVPGYVRDFASTHRFVLDFITEEVLGSLEPDVSEFLLRTSVLERLSGPLCDALTGRNDGQAMLERLERSNLLITPLDDERRWYRYHRLFADLLRARLAVVHPEEPAELHLRAADWYDRHGFAREAIEHGLRSGDAHRAGELIAKAAGAFIHAAEFATLRNWLDALPDEVVRSDLLLCIFYAYALALAGQTDGVDRRLADAEAAIPMAAAAIGNPVAATAPVHISMIRSIVARLRHEPRAAVTHAEQAVWLVPPGLSFEREALIVGDAQAILGHALLDAGELDRAIDAYRAARPRLELAGNRLAVADITRNLARLEVRRGRLRAALDTCDQALADAAGEAGLDQPALAPVHLARAEILDRMGEMGASGAAERALELARSGGDVVTLRDARALLERATARRPARPTPAPGLIERLTERELEVLRLVAAGRSNRQIAGELFLALGTVKTHVHAIAGKLGAANRVEAIARARELGLLG
jgi:LuxR family transcriptional regulator, maltose regulon positive regulatory protein